MFIYRYSRFSLMNLWTQNAKLPPRHPQKLTVGRLRPTREFRRFCREKNPVFLIYNTFCFLEIIILYKLRQMIVKLIMICKPRSPHGTSHKPRHFKGCRHFILSMDWVIIYHVGIWILTRNITVYKFVSFNKIMKTYFWIVFLVVVLQRYDLLHCMPDWKNIYIDVSL